MIVGVLLMFAPANGRADGCFANVYPSHIRQRANHPVQQGPCTDTAHSQDPAMPCDIQERTRQHEQAAKQTEPMGHLNTGPLLQANAAT